jgi:hypothetical protein
VTGSARVVCGITLVVAIVTALPARASVTRNTVVEAVKTETPPPMGFAAAQLAAWQKGMVATGFVDVNTLQPARLETIAYLLYDDTTLFVAFRCNQRGVPIVASETSNNSNVTSDDHVTLWIDTSGIGARTYSFTVTPRGTIGQTSSENSRYQPPWKAVADVEDGSYFVAMAIPLSDLRAQSGRVQTWRVNFERYVAATNGDYTWAFESAQTKISEPQFWPQLGDIRISAHATRPRPYAGIFALGSAGSQYDVFQNGYQNGNAVFGTIHPRIAGIDLTYPFTNTLAFVGTLNPDFSNVEEDQTTIAPQEFPKQYNEYRPFFAQGLQYINSMPQISLFGAGNTMFYTPSIGVFNRGLKIEGTSGANAIGLLNVIGPGIDDNAFGYTYARPDNTLALSSEGVLLQQDGITDNTFGFGAAQTNPRSGQFTDATYASEGGSLVGAAGTSEALQVAEGLRNVHWLVEGLYDDLGPEYSPLDGYTQINDVRGPGATVEYLGVGAAQSIIQSYTVSLFGDRFFDSDGNVREADANVFYTVNLKDLISISGFAGPSELRSYEVGYPVYSDGVTDAYNRRQVQLEYGANTATPITVSYAWGPFAGNYVQQTAASVSRVFGPYAVTLEYDGNIERAQAGTLPFNSQWLRLLEFTRSFGPDATIALEMRSINGTGGFALPGTNLAILYQQRFRNQNELYIEYGTPAASQTLHRFIAKYVVHVGGGTGS